MSPADHEKGSKSLGFDARIDCISCAFWCCGVCKPALLDSYSVERSAVGDMVLRNAGRLTDAAILRNPILQ
ncbi:MAG TPA: hypothetical protein VI232_00505, partial [Reyranella sp.]